MSGAAVPSSWGLNSPSFLLLQALKFLPTRRLASVPIVGAAFAPPVSVDAVARAAVTAVLDPAVPPGPMDVWDIAKYK